MIIYKKNENHHNEFYSQIVDTGYIVFISGQTGIITHNHVQKNKVNLNSINNQTKQALIKIKYLLEQINLKISNIVKITIFTKKINNLPLINITYKNFFNENNTYKLPSRSCLEVSNLPNNADIEIDAIAIRQQHIQKNLII